MPIHHTFSSQSSQSSQCCDATSILDGIIYFQAISPEAISPEASRKIVVEGLKL